MFMPWQVATSPWETFTLTLSFSRNKVVTREKDSWLVKPCLVFHWAVCLSGFLHINAFCFGCGSRNKTASSLLWKDLSLGLSGITGWAFGFLIVLAKHALISYFQLKMLVRSKSYLFFVKISNKTSHNQNIQQQRANLLHPSKHAHVWAKNIGLCWGSRVWVSLLAWNAGHIQAPFCGAQVGTLWPAHTLG